MATVIYIRQGTDAQRQNVLFSEGEPAWTVDTKRLYVGDGSTSGGIFVGGSGVGVFGVNSLVGDITLVGGEGISITTSGQSLVFDEEAGGLDVDSLNSLTGVVTLVGGSGISVTVSGQNITIDEETGGLDVDSIAGLTGIVTVSGAGITEVTTSGQQIIITSTETTDVDSLNSVTGAVTIQGAGSVNVTEVSQTITASGLGLVWFDSPTEVLSSGFTISGDMAYSDLSLSSYIPSSATMVILSLTLDASTMPTGDITMSVRKNGTSTTQGLKAYLSSNNGDTNNAINRAFGMCGVDGSGVIEWEIDVSNTNTYIATATIDLMGYYG